MIMIAPGIRLITFCVYCISVSLIPSREPVPFIIHGVILLLFIPRHQRLLRKCAVRLVIGFPFILLLLSSYYFSNNSAEMKTAAGLSLLFKYLLIFLSGILLFSDCSLTLAVRQLRVPVTVISVISIAERFIDVLKMEGMNMTRSVRLRIMKIPLMRRPRTAIVLSGSFLARGVKRSFRVFSAMTARGFTGEIHFLFINIPGSRDVLFAAGVTAILIFTQVYFR